MSLMFKCNMLNATSCTSECPLVGGSCSAPVTATTASFVVELSAASSGTDGNTDAVVKVQVDLSGAVAHSFPSQLNCLPSCP